MHTVTLESMTPLLRTDNEATVSLYFPTHRYPTADHIQEDKIRLKNLIRAGKEQLEARGVDADTVRKIGNRLDDLYKDDKFWPHTTEGLAVFCSLKEFHCFQLPMECDERACAGGAYDINPLLAFLSYDQPYYLLALATHQPALYRGDMYGIQPVEIDLPESPEIALNIDEMFSNSQTVRAGGGHGPGSPGSGSHGQGDSRQAGTEERLEFFRIVDDKILASDQVDSEVPLLIAGSEGEVSEYRERSRHKHLLSRVLHGNYTRTVGVKPQDLQARAWRIIEEELGRKKRLAAIERFNEMKGAGRSSANLADIKETAQAGRIDTLLVGCLTITRDAVRDDASQVMKLIFPKGYETEGIDSCSRTVYDQGGKVTALLLEEMPEGAPVAALYRY
jgi:hypothetical protein